MTSYCPRDSTSEGGHRKEGNEHSAKEIETNNHHFTQFARIDEGLFSWSFVLRDRHGKEIASVERGFRGWGREVSVIAMWSLRR